MEAVAAESALADQLIAGIFALTGAVIGGSLSYFAVRHQAKTEHERWLRQQQLDAYTEAIKSISSMTYMLQAIKEGRADRKDLEPIANKTFQDFVGVWAVAPSPVTDKLSEAMTAIEEAEEALGHLDDQNSKSFTEKLDKIGELVNDVSGFFMKELKIR